MNFIFKRCNLCKLYKNRCQKCQIPQGGPLHPPDDQSEGGKKIRGVPRTPLILTGGWRHPPGPPLKPPLLYPSINIVLFNEFHMLES